MEDKHFINLTNGIEAISEHNVLNPLYIRIQSTACEQKRWGFILDDLDYNFLMSLALGCRCFLYDYGANKDISRAMWQGVSWIKYALMRNWFGVEIDSFSKSGVNMNGCFSKAYYGLHKTTKKKLAYFKKFLNTDAINIQTVSGATKHDGDYKYYNQQLVQMQKAAPHNFDVII